MVPENGRETVVVVYKYRVDTVNALMVSVCRLQEASFSERGLTCVTRPRSRPVNSSISHLVEKVIIIVTGKTRDNHPQISDQLLKLAMSLSQDVCTNEDDHDTAVAMSSFVYLLV